MSESYPKDASFVLDAFLFFVQSVHPLRLPTSCPVAFPLVCVLHHFCGCNFMFFFALLIVCPLSKRMRVVYILPLPSLLMKHWRVPISRFFLFRWFSLLLLVHAHHRRQRTRNARQLTKRWKKRNKWKKRKESKENNNETNQQPCAALHSIVSFSFFFACEIFCAHRRPRLCHLFVAAVPNRFSSVSLAINKSKQRTDRLFHSALLGFTEFFFFRRVVAIRSFFFLSRDSIKQFG